MCGITGIVGQAQAAFGRCLQRALRCKTRHKNGNLPAFLRMRAERLFHFCITFKNLAVD